MSIAPPSAPFELNSFLHIFCIKRAGTEREKRQQNAIVSVAARGVLLTLLVSGIYRPKVLLIFSLKRLTQVDKRRDKMR